MNRSSRVHLLRRLAAGAVLLAAVAAAPGARAVPDTAERLQGELDACQRGDAPACERLAVRIEPACAASRAVARYGE
jgi:hypothetical protein